MGKDTLLSIALAAAVLTVLLALPEAFAGRLGDTADFPDNGPDLVVTVPAPGTLVLLTAGLGGLAWWLRRNR